MTGETVQFEQAAASSDEATKREQSTIGFPYHDLDAASEVAQAVYNRSGLGTCELDELAAEMGQVISGAFRVKLAAARTFELVEKDGRSAVKLSELGRRIVTDDHAGAAKIEAFLSVPLYAKIFDAYKGQKLPPMKALEREMATLGVAVKQTDKARQAFERAAKQAGFFDAGSDRLVRPRADAPSGGGKADIDNGDVRADKLKDDDAARRKGGGGEPPSGKDHPLINGLLVTLPDPGTAWDKNGRAAWLKMAESIFDMIYKVPSTKGNWQIDDDEDDDI
ncbi:hypothetical protein [Sphingopyxis granuli]|uniref:Uncharacterized protein n=1 Tax=Sphingopyxis granuli TaxID=267128 RepID=A0AA86L1J9_9SPHN|nr:hypothetical protein [Sphingopyxis granuli]AMG73254.1 Uncharacterized protein SGRAN_0860 [Sphingopyxis granuli]